MYKFQVIIAGRTVHEEVLNTTKTRAIEYAWEYARLDADSVDIRALTPDESVLWLKATWFDHYNGYKLTCFYILYEMD